MMIGLMGALAVTYEAQAKKETFVLSEFFESQR